MLNTTSCLMLVITCCLVIEATGHQHVICSSITLQGPINSTKFNKIRNCSVIVGHVRLLNARLDDPDASFVNLVEITDYLLVFQLHGRTSLATLFPKLTLIRGDQLFKQTFALVLFLASSLRDINIYNLMEIKHGTVLLSRLYQACYVNTVDWNYLIKNSTKPATIALSNNDCMNQICPAGSNCWSETRYQLKCNKCEACELTNTSICCNNSLCGYCFNQQCLTCSRYRNLLTGECVTECPSSMLDYEGHSCIRVEDCSTSRKSLVKSFAILNERHCVRECPSGYRLETHGEFRKCVKCDDGVCKVDCWSKSFILRTDSDILSARNCYRIKRLVIQLESSANEKLLHESLKYLEEIDEYLLVTRNKLLGSLGFLSRLRVIRGNALYEKRYALFIHTNAKLKVLWHHNVNSSSHLVILNGSVKFFENPSLCYHDIQSFLASNRVESHLVEVSFNFNGYKRLMCPSERKIQLKIEFWPRQIVVRWNITIVDLRRLNGYVLYYKETDSETTASELDDEWNSLFVEYDETASLRHMNAWLDVEPFTKYSLFVKADLNMDMNVSYQYDRLISDVHHVYSLPAQPSRVESIEIDTKSHDSVALKWNAPAHPNGLIEFYFIAYTHLDEPVSLYNTIDVCHSSASLFIPTSTATTTTQKPVEDKIICNEFIDTSRYKKSKKMSERMQKSDLISVEDEIYNLVFRPARSHLRVSNITSTTTTTSPTSTTTQVTSSTKHDESIHEDLSFLHDYNLDFNLLKLIKQDLTDEEKDLITLRVSNKSLGVHISDLMPFKRYILYVMACQNFTQALVQYSKKFSIHQMNHFPIEMYCSKPSSITFRTSPDARKDVVQNVELTHNVKLNSWTFSWTRPHDPNSHVFKYNLKFTDTLLNKTHGPLCHASVDNLTVVLDQFLLIEGHEYLIQVQAVSQAGTGPWSWPPVRYQVPRVSKFYLDIKYQIAIIVAGILAIVCAVLLFVGRCTKLSKTDYLSIKTQYYYFRPDDWEIKKENLIIEERIGSGCFSEVHKGKLRTREGELIDCAIKFCGSDKQSRQRLLKEANMMKSINTTHIVKMLGVISRDNPPYLILEYMDKGDLKEYLKNFRLQNIDSQSGMLKQEISASRFYRIAAEIADGMLWLSEHKYIHRDLAARNCLISKQDVIKIADLGLSKDIYQNPIYREKCKGLLPIRWMSPESLSNGASSTKSDVWSFGVVVWEMATYGENPYSGKENEQVITFVKNGGRLELPVGAPFKFSIILNRCMIKEDYKRADFKDLLAFLDPDLTADFKQTSYYHNEFIKKSTSGDKSESQSTHSIAINRVVCAGNSDNYM